MEIQFYNQNPSPTKVHWCLDSGYIRALNLHFDEYAVWIRYLINIQNFDSTIGLYQSSWFHIPRIIRTEMSMVGAGEGGDKGKSTGSVLQKLDC